MKSQRNGELLKTLKSHQWNVNGLLQPRNRRGWESPWQVTSIWWWFKSDDESDDDENIVEDRLDQRWLRQVETSWLRLHGERWRSWVDNKMNPEDEEGNERVLTSTRMKQPRQLVVDFHKRQQIKANWWIDCDGLVKIRFKREETRCRQTPTT